MSWIKDPNRVDVYSESRKRRQFVGALTRDASAERYRFEYDRAYLRSPRAIPLGPELSLAKPLYESEPKTMFPSFADRIPSRNNPAYAEYCAAAGISPEENDPMILLPTIARRGPSTFIFEIVWKESPTLIESLKRFRKETGLSFHDLAGLLDIRVLSLKRLEGGLARRDAALSQLLRVIFDHPDLLLDFLRIHGARLHDETRRQLETKLRR